MRPATGAGGSGYLPDYRQAHRTPGAPLKLTSEDFQWLLDTGPTAKANLPRPWPDASRCDKSPVRTGEPAPGIDRMSRQCLLQGQI